MWMCIPQGVGGDDRWKIFDRVYKPSALTSFDTIISEEEFSFPVFLDNTSAGAANAKVSPWKDKKILSEDSSEDLTKIGNDGGMLGKIGVFAGQM